MNKGLIAVAVAGLALVSWTRADSAPSKPAASGYIEKFEVPERDADGNLRWKLIGDRALFGEQGQLTVLNLRAEFYQSNQVALVFTSPEAALDQVNRRATTESPVRLEAPNIVVTGDGAEWLGVSNTFLVRRNVQVIITGEPRPTTEKPVPDEDSQAEDNDQKPD